MKYYETTYDEYITSVINFNIHSDIQPIINSFPKNIYNFENLIIYGPPGTGKYSQSLQIIKKYSPSNLKYDKKMIIQTDKNKYKYKISDIHYEIDMSLLGCNSKNLWHELFFQIIDIISVHPTCRCGIIVCKNFHTIHSELLEIFYSYIQHYNHNLSNIHIKFILITEQISFIPDNIIKCSHILNIKRPNKKKYQTLLNLSNKDNKFINKTELTKLDNKYNNTKQNFFNIINTNDIINIKELQYFTLLEVNKNTITNLPDDNFNIVCNKIIHECSNNTNINYVILRDLLYDMLTYNLDISECIWYIIYSLIQKQNLNKENITDILIKSYTFFKYFNNNYRPIYHLESIIFYIISKLNKYEL